VPDMQLYVYAMLLAPLGLILFAAVYKSLRVRAASDWPSTPGKVVISNSELRDVRVMDEQREDGFRLELRNFANIVYQYSVSGQKLTNNRVSIGDDRGNFGVAETIARYPVGTDVTVYYNSRHPRDAVLERDTPKGFWGCLGIGTAVVLVIMFGSLFGLNQLTAFISTRLGNPRMSAPVVFFAAFGSILALFALALQRQASLAKKWPVVSGMIKMSDIEQYRAAPDKGSFTRGPVMVRRQVSCVYRFDNIAYSNVQGSLATGVNSTSGWLMRKFTTAYQDGASVNVYVNPLNPSEATLNPRGGVVWILSILWLGALAFAWAAYYVATHSTIFS
jgi:Protein of unknown function (DUF3592)